MAEEPEWIAHRGASWLAPENTLASVQLAWLTGADAVEVDVRVSADGVPVLFHDERLDRICGCEGWVREMTADQLGRLDAGLWKGEQWRGERIPALSEVLYTLPPGKRLFLDLKSGPESVPPLLDLLNHDPDRAAGCVVLAFSLELASLVKESRPETEVCWLVDQQEWRERESRTDPGLWIDTVRSHHLDGLDLSFYMPEQDMAAVRMVHDAGLRTYVWTVNEPDVARAALEAGAGGITTDRPAALREETLASYGWGLMAPLRGGEPGSTRP